MHKASQAGDSNTQKKSFGKVSGHIIDFQTQYGQLDYDDNVLGILNRQAGANVLYRTHVLQGGQCDAGIPRIGLCPALPHMSRNAQAINRNA